jgi:hypothetical protein
MFKGVSLDLLDRDGFEGAELCITGVDRLLEAVESILTTEHNYVTNCCNILLIVQEI